MARYRRRRIDGLVRLGFADRADGLSRLEGGLLDDGSCVEETVLCLPSRGAPLPVVGSMGWPSVNVSRFTSPADAIAAKAVKRIAEARIVSIVTRMNREDS